MLKVVIDTNILVSAILNPKGTPAKIVKAWFKNRFIVVISQFSLQEIERVLHYEHIQKIKHISEDEIHKLVTEIIKTSELIQVSSTIEIIKTDIADNQVLATAVDGQTTYIISGDHHLLDLGEFRGIKILKPADFLNVLQGN